MSGALPKLSILMTVCNGERYLREALDALLGQTYRDFELVAVNNGSTDTTGDILSDYAARDGRIRVLTNPVDPEGTFTKGIATAFAAATGEYVAVNDADDNSAPERLARQVAYLDAHPDAVLVASHYETIDETGAVFGEGCPPTGHDEILAAYMHGNPIAHSSVMYRRDAAVQAGGYDPALTFASDYNLQLNMAAQGGRFSVLPEKLVQIRVHAAQTSLLPGKAVIRTREPFDLLCKAGRLPGLSLDNRVANAKAVTKAQLRYAAALWMAGRKSDGWREAVAAFLRKPLYSLAFSGYQLIRPS